MLYFGAMKWRRLSLRELAAVQAVVAIVSGLLLVSLFAKIPLLPACVISIVFALVGTLVILVGIKEVRDPEDDGGDFWRNFPDDKPWP